LRSGELAVWGHNADGQLAEVPSSPAALLDRLEPHFVAVSGQAVVGAAALFAHSLALVVATEPE